jgi:hypothetical protein
VLIVDDFGVEYVGKRHAEHLLTTHQDHYTVTTNWTGSKFANIDVAWDYNKRTCRTTMPGYIDAVQKHFGHPNPTKPEHSPHTHGEITYGAHEQYANNDQDTSPKLDSKGTTRVQAITGAILYCTRAVDNKLLMILSAIAAHQAAPRENTLAEINKLLNYVATHPAGGITYPASNMILAAHLDASYLSKPNARSRAGAHIFVSKDDPIPRPNGPTLSIAQVIKLVTASAAEAELAGLFITA